MSRNITSYTLIIISSIILSSCTKAANQSDQPDKTVKTDKTDKIQQCPDSWIVNRMPRSINEPSSRPTPTPIPSEYFILDEKRRELSEFDMEWVEANCDIEKQYVY